jgi:hypothetical protein
MQGAGTVWTEEQRAKRRDDYARNYSSNHAGRAQGIQVPTDVVILASHEPCLRCGAAGACRHRPWLRETQTA